MSSQMTLMRLQKQQASIQRDPIPNALIFRQGNLNFHFCLYQLDGCYRQGIYHGLLQLHQNYPLNAPKLYFYTPNGRFDLDTPICTSFTHYHPQSWSTAWNVRSLVLATISFMYSQQPSYGCREDSEQNRKKMAKNSMKHNMKNASFMEMFGQKLKEMGKLQQKQQQMSQKQGKDLVDQCSNQEEKQSLQSNSNDWQSFQEEEQASIDQQKKIEVVQQAIAEEASSDSERFSQKQQQFQDQSHSYMHQESDNSYISDQVDLSAQYNRMLDQIERQQLQQDLNEQSFFEDNQAQIDIWEPVIDQIFVHEPQRALARVQDDPIINQLIGRLGRDDHPVAPIANHRHHIKPELLQELSQEVLRMREKKQLAKDIGKGLAYLGIFGVVSYLVYQIAK